MERRECEGPAKIIPPKRGERGHAPVQLKFGSTGSGRCRIESSKMLAGSIFLLEKLLSGMGPKN